MKKDIAVTIWVILSAIFLAVAVGVTLSIGYNDKNANKNSGQNATQEPKDIQEKQANIPIIAYHYVEIVTDERDFLRKNMAITPATFIGQINFLREKGYEPVFVRDIPDILNNKVRLDKKPVVLTFDDGYGDFYTDVLPILKQYDVKATAYIVPAFIGQLNYMTKAQIEEAVESGFVEIGAHTMHHAEVTDPTYEIKGILKSEIVDSKNALEKMFNVKAESFSYPYGRYNDKAIAILKDAGFITAVSEDEGSTVLEANLFSLPRTRVGYFDTILW